MMSLQPLPQLAVNPLLSSTHVAAAADAPSTAAVASTVALPVASTPALPSLLTIPAADAAKVTLNPSDCHRLGVFPYFRENVEGMFVRVKLDKSSNNHVWARVAAGVTAEGLSEVGLLGGIGGSDVASPLMYTLPTAEEEKDVVQRSEAAVAQSPEVSSWLSLPNMWRRRLVDEPVYEWREKRFDLYLICEHPFAGDLNRASTSSDANTAVLQGEESLTAVAPVPANNFFIVSFRQLSKEHAPTQADVDAFCAQFVPIQTDAAATALPTDALSNPFAAAVQQDQLSYIPHAFKVAFMNPPAQSVKEAEAERLEARIQERVGKSSNKGRTDERATDVTVVPSLPHVSLSAKASDKWSKHFDAHVINRSLSKDDAMKVVSANTRLNNVVGNTVIRGAVMYNLNLSRASQVESARRSTEHAHIQSVKAAQKALSLQSMAQTRIAAMDNNLSMDAEAFPAATQLGSASQNEFEGLSQDVNTSSLTAAFAAVNSAADVDALLLAALGPTATEAQLSDLKSTILLSQQAASVAADAKSKAAAAQQNMMLLTADELRTLESDEHSFNQYIATSARKRDMDTLAAVTLRNARVNIALSLKGYKLMAVRDIEREAHDDTMQTMWVTDAEARKNEADEYIKQKAAEAEKGGEKGGKKDDGKKAIKGPRYLTEDEELEMYVHEAKRANDTALQRQGSTTSLSGASSGSLARASSVAEAVGSAILGAADDLDDLLSLNTRLAGARSISKETVVNPLVRNTSILSQAERINVSQSLGRIPVAVAGAKRGRE